jgi:hypothetical protein
MSKPLTLLNREDKGDVDPGAQPFIVHKLSANFPSYFVVFYTFSRFLILRRNAAFRKRLLRSKLKIPVAAAFMAIV